MSENGDIYTAGKNFLLPPAVTNLTSALSQNMIKYKYFGPNREGGKGQFRVKEAFSSLLVRALPVPESKI